MLLSALNACMTVGYVAGAAVRGIRLTSLEIETRGELDLRGFLNLSDSVPPGYGIQHSILTRMREVGGQATVDSHPGQGTRVDLRWPA